MIEKRAHTLSLWTFHHLAKHENVCHFVSTRNGGLSSPPYDSFNLGFHVGDDPELVLKNRETLAAALEIPLGNLTFMKQIHGCNVEIVTNSLQGRGACHDDNAINAADSMITETPGICLTVLQADCVPILFYDAKKRVIGVAHAGLKGTILRVAQNTVRVMQDTFHCSPLDIAVGIGPSIGPCCYEVGVEIADLITKAFPDTKELISIHTSAGKTHFNLWEANRIQLMQMGIPEGNIEISQTCTYCNHTLFFSHRYQNKVTGRFGAGIMLRPAK